MEQLTQLSYAFDTFYLLICGALVMWMGAGFAMLEAGLVRSKNTTEILTKNVVLYAVACVMYLICGYYIMYSSTAASSCTDASSFLCGILPSFGWSMGDEHALTSVLSGEDGAPHYSKRADFFFQVVFVATAMSIVSGAVAERMKLWAFLAFCVVMTGFIYPVEGYWKWGGGFLNERGFLDFAGSGVVHLTGGAAALAGVLLLGARKGKYGPRGQVNAIPGANLPLATIGAFILWLGWFGFNGGSQLKMADFENANAVAQVFVNTNAAAAAGVIAALILAKLWFRKADLTMALNGALAGLVAITAEPITPTAELATLIGAIAGVLVVFSIVLMDKLKIDDPVGAISVHGVCGIWGLMAVPITNPDGSFLEQAIGAGVIFGWVFITSLIVWAILKAVVGIRVTEEEEYAGVDLAECGMEAYPEFVKVGK